TTRTRPPPTSASRYPARSAGAPGTRTSSSRCCGRPSTVPPPGADPPVTPRSGESLPRRPLAGTRPGGHLRCRVRPRGPRSLVRWRAQMTHAYGPLPRKEDARFIRGQGKFVDDIALPGMLHGAVLRSPLAHARIVSVDAEAARAHPAVVAVLTGTDL